MIAVYTYYPLPGKESCGFKNKNDLAMFLSLSVEYSKKHFGKVKLETTTRGKEILIDKYGIGFTDVSVSLDGFNFPEELWAYPKIVSYSLQREPFVHIDLDVILWEKIPKGQCDIFFQHNEDFKVERGYIDLVKALNNTTLSYFLKSQNVNYAYNCGVVGFQENNTLYTRHWKELADEFLFNPANKAFWDSQSNKERFNYVMEQYFIACLLSDYYVEPSFLLEIETESDLVKPKYKMTHLWGKTKLSPTMDSIRKRLKEEYPGIYDKINKFEFNETSVFKCVFDKLSDKIKLDIYKKKIKSIVYLGFTGTSSLYVNIDGTVTEFLYSDKVKNIIPSCDLLIIKDMMFKWTPEQYSEFITKGINSKYVYDGRGIFKTGK